MKHQNTKVWIPKKIFPAVMMARQMIGDGGTEDSSVRKAAQYYNLEPDAVSEWLNKGNEPQYFTSCKKWYFAAIYCSVGATGDANLIELRYGQTLSRSAEERKIARECQNRTKREDTGSVYRNFYIFIMCETLYETKEEAEKAALLKMVQTKVVMCK